MAKKIIINDVQYCRYEIDKQLGVIYIKLDNVFKVEPTAAELKEAKKMPHRIRCSDDELSRKITIGISEEICSNIINAIEGTKITALSFLNI